MSYNNTLITNQSSTDSYYYLPYTLPVHLPGLVSVNPQDSPHMPLPQKALPPEVPGYTDVMPEVVGTNFGMETSFKFVANDYEVLKEAILIVRLAPLVAGTNGVDPRYPDDPIMQALDYYQWQIGGQTIQQRWGDEVHFRERVEDNPDEYARKTAAQSMLLSKTERVARANKSVTYDGKTFPNGQWFLVELPFFWSETAAKHWHQYACQRQTRIVLKWRNADAILQSDAVAPGAVGTPQPDSAVSTRYIMDCFLRFRTSSLDTSVKDSFTDGVKALGANGLNYLLEYTQRQENNVLAAGNSTYTIQLSNFNKPTYMLRFVVRKSANVAPNVLINDRWSLVNISSFQADASGHRLWPLMTSFFSKYMVAGREFLNNPEHEIHHVLHTDYADVQQYPMGCIEYAKLQNPTLTINFDSATAEDYVVDIYAYCYDYVRLVISSDNRSAVALEQPI